MNDTIEYQPLPTEFKKHGFHHRLIRREGDFCIFERKAPHHRDAHFEVIVIQFRPAWSIAGKNFPATEGYPSSEQWGTAGWTYGTLLDAERRLSSLLNAVPCSTRSDSSDFDGQTACSEAENQNETRAVRRSRGSACPRDPAARLETGNGHLVSPGSISHSGTAPILLATKA